MSSCQFAALFGSQRLGIDGITAINTRVKMSAAVIKKKSHKFRIDKFFIGYVS
jgi:hypothetical protein